MNDGLGKAAEAKIKKWLDRPDDGYSFDRIPDQVSGWYGSSNICDFICFKSPYQVYIESKSTWEDRFDFSLISEVQHDGLLDKSKIQNVFGVVIILFATYKRAFWIDIREISRMETQLNKHSLNIKKVSKWPIKFNEIETVPNNRQKLLDYTGELEDYLIIPEDKE